MPTSNKRLPRLIPQTGFSPRPVKAHLKATQLGFLPLASGEPPVVFDQRIVGHCFT